MSISMNPSTVRLVHYTGIPIQLKTESCAANKQPKPAAETAAVTGTTSASKSSLTTPQFVPSVAGFQAMTSHTPKSAGFAWKESGVQEGQRWERQSTNVGSNE